MFIGVLVLVIGSLQITFTTSTPVINKLFGTKLAPPLDHVVRAGADQAACAAIPKLLRDGKRSVFRSGKRCPHMIFAGEIAKAMMRHVVPDLPPAVRCERRQERQFSDPPVLPA